MSIEEINKMSHEQLIAAAVEIDVAKWGESEREGSRRIRKSNAQDALRLAIATHHGISRDGLKGRKPSTRMARHAAEDGLS
jgi:hypothetical protein